MSEPTDVVTRAKTALEGVYHEPWLTYDRGVGWEVHRPYCHEDGTGYVSLFEDDVTDYTNAQFIVTARSLIPELIAEVERLRAGVL